MADHKDVSLTGEIKIDAKVFENVTFKDANLVYCGGVSPVFKNCTFENVGFSLRDEAANTVQYLRGMAGVSTGMRSVVEGFLPELKA